jgi:hypothetical protein
MCGISRPGQWESAQALYVVGSLAANIVNSFYAATFPSLVRDLPKIIESEENVRLGTQSPEEHNKLDAYERSKVSNDTTGDLRMLELTVDSSCTIWSILLDQLWWLYSMPSLSVSSLALAMAAITS